MQLYSTDFIFMRRSGKRVRINIGSKAILMIISFALVLILTAMTQFSTTLSNNNKNTYKNTANSLSATIATIVDREEFSELKTQVKTIYDKSASKPTSEEWGSDKWKAYIKQFDEIKNSPTFIRVRQNLRDIANSNKANSVDCFFLAYVDVAHSHLIYLVDTAPDDDACPPGCIDPIYPVNKEVLTNPKRGFPAYITNTSAYGYLVTAGTPVYDSNNEVIGYGFVDLSMTTIRQKQANSITIMFFILVGAVAFISVIGILVVHFTLSKPIKKLTEVAGAYDSSHPEKTHEDFVNLNINTHDEVADLAESMKKMENDVNRHINELVIANTELARSQREAKEMTELANRDGLTGVHNKYSYNAEMFRINRNIGENKAKPFAVLMVDLNYLKSTNDEYGHDAGDNALIKLSNIICNIFVHSPVYRIGGDEFVIITRGHDYNHLEELVDTFNKEIEEAIHNKELPPEEQISAAIGYSRYIPESDTTLDDVFKRADKAMYEKKRRMKEEK